MNHRHTALQFIKYGIVGCANTLITLGVIFVCKSFLGVNEYVANLIGYVAGLLNSFFWNRRWVFKSDGGLTRQATHFLIGFGVCYAIQFATVWLLSQAPIGNVHFKDMEFKVLFGFVISGYGIATLCGNVCYTLCNFAYNRLLTFKEPSAA